MKRKEDKIMMNTIINIATMGFKGLTLGFMLVIMISAFKGMILDQLQVWGQQ